MTNILPDTAFILAAGKGTRLRPYTDNVPKPMVLIDEKPIIGHIIDSLIKVGIKRIIINLHYKGHIIKKYVDQLENDIEIILSDESELLDTGGGVKYALKHIKSDSFFLINGDAFWIECQGSSIFKDISSAWDPECMDLLLLMQEVSKMTQTKGIGDYDVNTSLHATRSLEKTGQYMFSGVRIVKTSLIKHHPRDIFSFLEIMDQAEEKKSLFGHIYKGEWHHISTPSDLENVNRYLQSND